MANREGRFKKIRPRSTPNSTAHKHERCFQSKRHIYHPVLVCTFSQSWKTIRTKNCSNVFVRDLEQNFNIIIFKYILLITEHPTICFLNFVLLPVHNDLDYCSRSSSSTLAPASLSSKKQIIKIKVKVIILIIHEIISCIQYFFSFNFFNSVSSPLVVVAMLVKIFGTLDWKVPKIRRGVTTPKIWIFGTKYQRFFTGSTSWWSI